jgi:hypothetical protein
MRVTKRGVLRGVLALALAILVVNLGLLWLANRSLARAVSEAPGLRTRLSEFVPPAIPKTENASSYLNAAGELCSLSQEDVRLALRRRASAPSAAPAAAPLDAWRDIVRRNETALRILDAAADLDTAWFEADYSVANPADVRLPPLLQRRHLASVLRVRALLAAHDGRADDAYRDVLLILRMSDWCSQESPTLISALISVAIGGIAVDTLEDAMSLVPAGPELRAALEERLSGLRRADPIRRGLEGERTFQYGGFGALIAGRAEPGSTGLEHVVEVMVPRFYLRFDQAASLRAMTTLIQRADRTTADLNRAGESDGPKIPLWAVITRIAVPSLNRALYSRDELRARLDLGRLALAAEAWRSAHGSYPGGPPESWSTSDRVDPISGAPYSYEPKPDGFGLSGQPGRFPTLTLVVTTPTSGSPAAATTSRPRAGTARSSTTSTRPGSGAAASAPGPQRR